MQISLSSILTVYYDDQFCVGLAERGEEGTMPRGRGGGAFRAAKAEAQAEAPWALIRSIIPYTATGAASIETAPAI